MLILISPAKKLDFDNNAPTTQMSQCGFLNEANELIDILKEKSQEDIAKLMHLSDNLASLNVKRYQEFNLPITEQNGKQALFAFKGDVYASMQADTFTNEQIDFAQQHLRILSGLYGLLKPLDLMQAYRLEMGTKLANEAGKDLYAFWGNRITDAINIAIDNSGSDALINLASTEYFKSVKTAHINGKIITPHFKSLKTDKNGDTQYKVVGILAKRARGLMSRYIIENNILQADKIKEFDWQGYRYQEELSTGNDWVFTQDE